MQSQAKKKVCFIVTKGVWGGAQKYVYNLATNLDKNTYEAVVVCGEGEELPQKLTESGIKVHRLGSLKRDVGFSNEIKSFWQILSIIRNEKPDVLHLNSPKAGGLGGLAGRIAGVKKIIYTSHGWTWNENRSIFSKIAIILFSWIIVILSHKTVVIAEQEKNQALHLPLVKNKIVLIRNGIENIEMYEQENARKNIMEKIQKESADGLWIGTISELHKNKGLEYMIEALKNIKHPYSFFIIGKGEERKNLEKMIKENHLENKIFLVGFLENANKNLKAFDIFTLTSIKEGLPYTILEAGLASLPTIASSVGGIPEIIENGTSGILTNKKDIDGINTAIKYLIEKPEERERLGKNLQNKVKKDFSLEKMLQKTVALYK